MHAQKLSTLRPQLDAANVRSVAVGHEDVGAEDFVKAGVPIVEGQDLRDIWEPMFGEQFPK